MRPPRHLKHPIRYENRYHHHPIIPANDEYLYWFVFLSRKTMTIYFVRLPKLFLRSFFFCFSSFPHPLSLSSLVHRVAVCLESKVSGHFISSVLGYEDNRWRVLVKSIPFWCDGPMIILLCAPQPCFLILKPSLIWQFWRFSYLDNSTLLHEMRYNFPLQVCYSTHYNCAHFTLMITCMALNSMWIF